MKESDALKKYCPLKPLNAQVSNTCIGSDCMMWEPEYNEERKQFPVNELLDESWIIYGHDSDIKNAVRYVENDCGDCGLKTKESGCSYPG